ncbi:MAG: hypothetical protein ABI779_08410 [Acidobacteriota bacterium]
MRVLPVLFYALCLSLDATAQFDPSVSQLPSKFVGTDVKTLVRALRTSTARGEFESTAQYQQRLAAATPRPAETHAFRVRAESITYDSDAETFTIVPSLTVPYMGTSPVWAKAALVSDDVAETSAYEGRNGFGAAVAVQQVVREIHMVQATPPWREATPSFTVRVPRDKAAIRKPNLKVLLLARFSSADALPESVPQTLHVKFDGATGWNHIEPTFQTPKEEISIYFTAVGEFIEWWVYDFVTGEILGRFSPRVPADVAATGERQ